MRTKINLKKNNRKQKQKNRCNRVLKIKTERVNQASKNIWYKS